MHEELRRALGDGKLVHDAVVHPLHNLLQEPKLRADGGEVRELMRPRAHNCLHRRNAHLAGCSGESRHRVHVSSCCRTPHRQHGNTRRASGHHLEAVVAPVLHVRTRAVEPFGVGGMQALQAREPRIAPSLTTGKRLAFNVHRQAGRLRHSVQHPRAPGQVGVEQRAPHEVHVVRKPVLGGANGNDSLERRGWGGCSLQRRDASPGTTEKHHLPVAPRLLRRPLYGVV
mmetsp:Transcript_44606/g.83271  ORF Transcript_44606/g.83271 Transcript_44606/m.83271 type:complete len:228 (-) Transcript_44606:1114-1797(-)